ncbi:hypothetical protein [Desulfofustis glycolicus]|uniref:Uncharacterized protein n=1 Tax=Desulfofustis glycolicus DSM 9705 TaxID=1121409 RepID=A0A1M5UPG0_9BACT|nr:hypothetical protein [Desulfofustis glycolicus]MCB2217372.1 hypothetical protein [Desulfobulbaceae bacterium]SHH64867.1 hypothetical protein SAMN02745124_01295 [Desulfofustis glycolicus DSM 9705]
MSSNRDSGGFSASGSGTCAESNKVSTILPINFRLRCPQLRVNVAGHPGRRTRALLFAVSLLCGLVLIGFPAFVVAQIGNPPFPNPSIGVITILIGESDENAVEFDNEGFLDIYGTPNNLNILNNS